MVQLVKRKRIAFFIALFVVAIFLVWYILAKPETYRDVADAVYESILKHDARTLFKYLLDEEVNAIDLNVRKLDNLLRLFNSRLEGFQLVEKSYDFWEEGNDLIVAYKYHHKDGRYAWVGIEVVLTDNGVRAACLTRDIARAIATTYFEPNIVNPSGIQLFRQFLQAIQKAMPSYKATGLAGFAKPVKLTGNFKLTTWEEWRDWYAEQIKTIETQDTAHPRQ